MIDYLFLKQMAGVVFNPHAFTSNEAIDDTTIAGIDDKVDEALAQLGLDLDGRDFCDRIEAACPGLDMDTYLDGLIENFDYLLETGGCQDFYFP